MRAATALWVATPSAALAAANAKAPGEQRKSHVPSVSSKAAHPMPATGTDHQRPTSSPSRSTTGTTSFNGASHGLALACQR
jgi:hypothetical protein